MSTRVDGFVRSLEMVKVESWMIYVNRLAQEKVSRRLKKKNVSFVLFVLIFLLPTWKAGSMLANIALHGYCFDNLTQGKAQRKVSRKKKRGSHGWERERQETLPTPSSFLAVGEEGKIRGQIGNISASKGSRAVVWGGRKNATLSLPQTGLSAPFARRLFFFADADFLSFSPKAELGPRLLGFFRSCFPSASSY